MISVHIFSSIETEPDFVSRAIMKKLKCDYSHIGVAFNGSSLYHATGKGVHLLTRGEFLKDHKMVHEIPITKFVHNFSYARGWCEGNVGKDYSESQFIGFMFPALKKFFGDGRKEVICSEFVARFIDECTEIDIFDEIDCDYVSPKELIEMLSEKVFGLK